MTQTVRTLVEQQVEGKLKTYVLPPQSLLSLIRENPTGTRTVGCDGIIWILEKGDYEHVKEEKEQENNPQTSRINPTCG